MKYKLLLFLFCTFFLVNCGFKVIDNNTIYKIVEVNTQGDKKTNYSLRNKLLANSNSESNRLVKINIITNKKRSIKERNINNQVTKYELKINAEIEYSITPLNIKGKFNSNVSGFYDVASRYSETLNNEKILINLLVKDLANNILDNLTDVLNDS